MNNKIKKCFIGLPAFFLLFFALPAQAFVFKTGQDIIIPKDEVISETLLAAGQTIVIDGNVSGDIICAGQTLTINGSVGGDIICAGQTIVIANNVVGSVRAAGQTVQIKGGVARNVTVAGQTIILDSEIRGEMLFAGRKAVINGKISNDALGMAESVLIKGEIGGDAEFIDSNLSLEKNALVFGNLTYSGASQAVIQDGAKVLGTIKRNIIADKPTKEEKSRPKTEISGAFKGFAIQLVCALLFIYFFRNYTGKVADMIISRPKLSIGWGVIFLFFTPVIALAFAITIIGLPVGLLMILLYLSAIFFSVVFAGLALGRKVIRRYWKSKQDSLFWQALLGIALLWVLFLIPAIGTIIIFIAIIWGLGGQYNAFKKNALIP